LSTDRCLVDENSDSSKLERLRKKFVTAGTPNGVLLFHSPKETDMGGKPRVKPIPLALPDQGLIPADLTQCQAEKPNGHSFMTLGGQPGLVRCKRVPVYIAFEKEPNPVDGLRGSMSLCEECKSVHEEQMPGTAIYEEIRFTVKVN
jgi:hypothetical protein